MLTVRSFVDLTTDDENFLTNGAPEHRIVPFPIFVLTELLRIQIPRRHRSSRNKARILKRRVVCVQYIMAAFDANTVSHRTLGDLSALCVRFPVRWLRR